MQGCQGRTLMCARRLQGMTDPSILVLLSETHGIPKEQARLSQPQSTLGLALDRPAGSAAQHFQHPSGVPALARFC